MPFLVAHAVQWSRGQEACFNGLRRALRSPLRSPRRVAVFGTAMSGLEAGRLDDLDDSGIFVGAVLQNQSQSRRTGQVGRAEARASERSLRAPRNAISPSRFKSKLLLACLLLLLPTLLTLTLEIECRSRSFSCLC